MNLLLTKTINQLKSNYPNFEEDLQKEIIKQEISLKLIQLRLESGLTQSVFAQQLGLKQTQLSRFESGTGNPTIFTLQKIAKRTGYDLDISFKKINEY